MAGLGQAKTGGRKAGVPNKTTALLKDAILEAGAIAGGDDGLVGYLAEQAKANPEGYMRLLQKVLPIQQADENVRKLGQPMDLALFNSEG